jgi:hypothetical protein
MEKHAEHEPWFGLEQEYTLMDLDNRPVSFDPSLFSPSSFASPRSLPPGMLSTPSILPLGHLRGGVFIVTSQSTDVRRVADVGCFSRRDSSRRLRFGAARLRRVREFRRSVVFELTSWHLNSEHPSHVNELAIPFPIPRFRLPRFPLLRFLFSVSLLRFLFPRFPPIFFLAPYHHRNHTDCLVDSMAGQRTVSQLRKGSIIVALELVSSF